MKWTDLALWYSPSPRPETEPSVRQNEPFTNNTVYEDPHLLSADPGVGTYIQGCFNKLPQTWGLTGRKCVLPQLQRQGV